MSKRSHKRNTFILGVSRDGGNTWTQEVVNVYELNPETSTLAVGDLIWFRKKKFSIVVTPKGLQAKEVTH